MMFEGMNFFVLESMIGKSRRTLFSKQIHRNKGKLITDSDKPETNVPTYIIVDDQISSSLLMKLLPSVWLEKSKCVKSMWLSSCLKNKEMMNIMDYEIKIERDDPTKSITITGSNIENSPAPKLKDGDDGPSPKKIKETGWACAHSSLIPKASNHNQLIVEKLKEMKAIYESRGVDKWRALGYEKAISALTKHPHPITSYEEARAVKGVGEKLALKMYEIVQTGELRKLNELSNTEESKVLKLFTNIWGVGTATAAHWFKLGLRTLDELNEKVNLTKNQLIGIKHYDDFLERMPREEARKIEKIVVDATTGLLPNSVAMACGSYRRGKETCGDVDVLITHPDGTSHAGILKPLLSKLHDNGFITDDLVSHDESGRQSKYMGVCKLPEPGSKHRRLDILAIPYDEFACASLYFTGSAHFNRSMRSLAHKKGMSLSEHSLSTQVIRNSSGKLTNGIPLPTVTERDVFDRLGLDYLEPQERNH